MIISKTPVRIAFGGGGTDVEPYTTEYGGFVLNTTINLYFRSILSQRNDNLIRIFSSDTFTTYEYKTLKILEKEHRIDDLVKAIIYLMNPLSGMDVFLHGEAPKRAGLGASASLSTSLIAGILELQHNKIDIKNIAELAYKVETEILQNAGGRQDQYAAVFGGINEIKFLGGENVKINKLKLSTSFERKLEKNLILFYTGEPHVSGSMVEKQINSYITDKSKAKNSLDKLKEIAYNMKDALNSEDFEIFGQLLTEDWNEKTKFNPYLTTDYMRALNKIVMEKGGIGGRVCGAGGGGCMIWLIQPKNRNQVLSSLNNNSGKIIDYDFVKKGLKIENI